MQNGDNTFKPKSLCPYVMALEQGRTAEFLLQTLILVRHGVRDGAGNRVNPDDDGFAEALEAMKAEIAEDIEAAVGGGRRASENVMGDLPAAVYAGTGSFQAGAMRA